MPSLLKPSASPFSVNQSPAGARHPGHVGSARAGDLGANVEPMEVGGVCVGVCGCVITSGGPNGGMLGDLRYRWVGVTSLSLPWCRNAGMGDLQGANVEPMEVRLSFRFVVTRQCTCIAIRRCSQVVNVPCPVDVTAMYQMSMRAGMWWLAAR
jgi:hypothetical protein